VSQAITRTGPHWDGVLDELLRSGDPRVVGERRPEGVAVVMVPDERMDGHRQGLEELADPLVLLGPAEVREVAREQHGDRGRVEREQGVHGCGERPGRLAVSCAEADV
jgi:hypothetical protein